MTRSLSSVVATLDIRSRMSCISSDMGGVEKETFDCCAILGRLDWSVPGTLESIVISGNSQSSPSSACEGLIGFANRSGIGSVALVNAMAVEPTGGTTMFWYTQSTFFSTHRLQGYSKSHRRFARAHASQAFRLAEGFSWGMTVFESDIAGGSLRRFVNCAV